MSVVHAPFSNIINPHGKILIDLTSEDDEYEQERKRYKASIENSKGELIVVDLTIPDPEGEKNEDDNDDNDNNDDNDDDDDDDDDEEDEEEKAWFLERMLRLTERRNIFSQLIYNHDTSNWILAPNKLTECPICWEDHDPNNTVILPCQHRFGRPCILTWRANHHTCPMCRDDINRHVNTAAKYDVSDFNIKDFNIAV